MKRDTQHYDTQHNDTHYAECRSAMNSKIGKNFSVANAFKKPFFIKRNTYIGSCQRY
jgi:hypothetical protein